MRLNLEGSALSWFHALPHPVSRDKGKLITTFKEHFGQLHPKWMLEQQLYDRCMSTSENLESYITDIESRCARLNKSNTEMTTVFIRGLSPALRMFVIQQNPLSFDMCSAVHKTCPGVNGRLY